MRRSRQDIKKYETCRPSSFPSCLDSRNYRHVRVLRQSHEMPTETPLKKGYRRTLRYVVDK
jgi:hypothetical protein